MFWFSLYSRYNMPISLAVTKLGVFFLSRYVTRLTYASSYKILLTIFFFFLRSARMMRRRKKKLELFAALRLRRI